MDDDYDLFCSKHQELLQKYFPYPFLRLSVLESMQREMNIRCFVLGYKTREQEIKH